jgi:hypothetical protein
MFNGYDNTAFFFNDLFYSNCDFDTRNSLINDIKKAQTLLDTQAAPAA